MTEKVLCPDDGLECIYLERKEEGSCFNCPKIQELLREVSESGEGDKGETKNG